MANSFVHEKKINRLSLIQTIEIERKKNQKRAVFMKVFSHIFEKIFKDATILILLKKKRKSFSLWEVYDQITKLIKITYSS